jgi:hypothetical protein
MSTQESSVSPNLNPSGATFAQLQNGGLQGILKLLIAANPSTANPTTPVTASATGGGTTGGLLPAGVYFASYTWNDGAGETTVGTSQLASPVTITAGEIPQFTIPAVPTGAAFANLYLTAAGGASGTETLYATGLTATTFNASFAAGTDPGISPPATNTTGALAVAKYINAPAAGPHLLQFWNRLTILVSNWISGVGVDFQSTRRDIAHLNYTLAVWTQATKEIGVLIAANHGTLTNVATQVQNRVVRTFP